MATKALHKPPPIPISERFLKRNMTIQHAPINITSVVIKKTVIPIGPVLNQIKTYSESGGMVAKRLYLLLAGTLSPASPIPIPQGASFMYFY